MFSIFKKKSAPATTAPSTPLKPAATANTDSGANRDTVNYKTPEFGAKLRQLLVGSKFLYRDATLSPDVLSNYRLGTFFREPTPFDTTHRFGGLAANTRFLVVSSSPISLSTLSANPEWGLCVFPTNELFKVIDVQQEGARAQVTVLHIPDELETYFRSEDASRFEALLTPQTRTDFQEALRLDSLPELSADAWRERTACPPGLNGSGVFVGA